MLLRSIDFQPGPCQVPEGSNLTCLPPFFQHHIIFDADFGRILIAVVYMIPGNHGNGDKQHGDYADDINDLFHFTF